MGYIHDVQKINDRLFCIKDVQSINKYLILGKSKALIFDTGFGFTDFKPLIREITNLDYFVVDSHSDVDHCEGNYLFPEVYISIHDYRNLNLNDDYEFKKGQVDYRIKKNPDLVHMMDVPAYFTHSIFDTHYHFLEEGDSFDLGDLQLEVIEIPGHTSGSICLWNEVDSWLFTGDSVMKHNVYYSQDQCEPMKVYYHSLQKLNKLQSKVKAIFPGHGEYGLAAHFIGDTIKNVEEIAAHKTEDEWIKNQFGLPVYQHSYAETLIFYSQHIRDDLLSHGL